MLFRSGGRKRPPKFANSKTNGRVGRKFANFEGWGSKISDSGEAVYSMEAGEFAQHMERLVEAGASLIGGCCGTTPEFIEALRGLKR